MDKRAEKCIKKEFTPGVRGRKVKKKVAGEEIGGEEWWA